jgi:hypothetical protein
MEVVMAFPLSARLFVIAIAVSIFSSVAFSQMPTKRNHEVPLDSAKKYIKNLEKDAVQMKTKGGMFYREIFDKMLAQKGCAGIRFYYAKMDDGSPTLVAVGVDTTGKDMANGTIAERVYPCPPYCSETSDLLK